MASMILYMFIGFVVALIVSAVVRQNTFLVLILSYVIAWVMAILLSLSKAKGD